MKHKTLVVAAISFFPFLIIGGYIFSACSNKQSDIYITIDDKKVVSVLSQGIGASMHAIEDSIIVTPGRSYGGSVWGGNPDLKDSEAWDKVFWHAKWLGIDWVRLELEQRMYNPERDTFTWDSYEMQVLYRFLDWCEEHEVDVLLQQMWSNVQWMAYPSHRSTTVGILRSAPYDKELFAQSFATLVDYLVHAKEYTCIKWLNFINEPDENWSWWQSEGNLSKKEDLAPVFAIVRRALDEKDISVPLLGPTYNIKYDPATFTFNNQLGGYDVHSYNAKFDWYKPEGVGGFDPIETTLKYFKRYSDHAQSEGKPFMVSEYGTFVYGFSVGNNASMSSRDAVLKDAELLIRSMNIGVNGFNKWSFINRGDLDGQWQLIDTWDIEKRKSLPADQIKPHENSYNAFALLSRYLPRDSKVLETSVLGGNDGTYDRVFATALQTPAGNYTILIINDSDSTFTVDVNFASQIKKEFYCYRFDDLTPQKVSLGKTLTLQPKDLVTLSTYYLKHDEAGMIKE